MFKLIIILLFFVQLLHNRLCNERLSLEISNILDYYKNSGYNKDVRPHYGAKKPLVVNVSTHIRHLSSVSEANMDFTADLILRQTWNDERLIFNETEDLKQLIVGAELIKNLWSPDTFITNDKSTSLHISTNLGTNSFLRIKSNGDVFYSLRMTVVAVCQMDLKYFPMDSQLCDINMDSYGYTIKDLEYFWLEPVATSYARGIALPNFQIKCYWNEKDIFQLSTGNYSRLRHRIVFNRSIGFYLNHVYIPAILVVVISWIPFWLDRDDNHARVGLGVTTVLTMTTLVTNTNAAMPKISYMKSLDIYLEVCFAMVFASLIQYAVVGFFTRKTATERHIINMAKERELAISANPSVIDSHSRWVFPSSFILFNVFYWLTVLNLSYVNELCSDLPKDN